MTIVFFTPSNGYFTLRKSADMNEPFSRVVYDRSAVYMAVAVSRLRKHLDSGRSAEQFYNSLLSETERDGFVALIGLAEKFAALTGGVKQVRGNGHGRERA